MKNAVVLGVVLASLALRAAAAPVPAYRAGKEKADKDAIQGTWVWVSAEAGGKKEPDADFKAKQVVTVIRDGTMTVRYKGRETQRAEYRLDPAKSPKQIDITMEQGGQTFVLKGIYRLDGDALILCYGGPRDERPKKFVSEAGSQVAVLRLQRKKE